MKASAAMQPAGWLALFKKGAASIQSAASPSWLFWILLCGALGLNLRALWGVTWLPMGDLGGWIELMDIMARYNDPGTMYNLIYEIPRKINPNSLAVYFGALVGPLVPANTAAKILVSWYVVGTPLSVLALCRAFDRSRWLVFFSAPMVFNSIFNVGFLNYLIGIPLIFFAAALARTYGEYGRWWRGLLLAFVLVVLFFSHVFTFLIGWSIALTVIVVAQRRVWRLWPMAAPLPFFISWYYRKFVLLEATEQGATFGTKKGLGFVFETLDERFADIYPWGMRFFRDNTEEVALIVIIVAWLAMMAMGQSSKTRGIENNERPLAVLRRYSLEIVTLCCVIAYFILPSHMHQLELIAERVIVLIVFLLVVWPRLDFGSWAQRALLVPVIAASLVFPVKVLGKFEQFEVQALGNLPQAIADLPDRTRMSYVMWQRGEDPITYQGPLWHIPKAIHAVRNGGITDDSFAVRPYSPVLYRKGRTPWRLGGQFWKDPHMHDYDYVLLNSSTSAGEALTQPSMKLVFQENTWWLFKVLNPDERQAAAKACGSGG